MSVMTASGITEMLETEWPSLAERLGSQWGEFLAGYRRIVMAAPEDLTRADLEREVDALCELINAYEPTADLLRDYWGAGRERLPSSPADTLRDQEEVTRVHNRLVLLPDQATAIATPDHPRSPQEKRLEAWNGIEGNA